MHIDEPFFNKQLNSNGGVLKSLQQIVMEDYSVDNTMSEMMAFTHMRYMEIGV